MAPGVCPECGTAPCALRPVCPGESEGAPQPLPRALACRMCARGHVTCDGGCDVHPFMD